MPYRSVDQLQKVLTEKVFHYAKDSKKAAGRALGTLVEIITFYALKSWKLEHNIAIERPLPEFLNKEITHNVEYSLHPSIPIRSCEFNTRDLPITARKIIKTSRIGCPEDLIKNNVLLTKENILRNSCTICDRDISFLNVYLDDISRDKGHYSIHEMYQQPFAIFECKRVGIEEGMSKGPQTIEKAKQGAYVARSVSALQKIRLRDGSIGGVIQKRDNSFIYDDYYKLLVKIIASNDPELLSHFIMTVGVVSNHGNWFTSQNHNKELKVLAQSYDWLLFLTDEGIAQFVEEILLNPVNEVSAARDAFIKSYTGEKGVNRFTKVQIALDADHALQNFFESNLSTIESWFNIISPVGRNLELLRTDLNILSRKNWKVIHNDRRT